MIRTLRAAISTFTLLPVGRAEIRDGDGAALVGWLVAVGALVGALGGLVFVAVLSINDRAGLLASVIAIGALALLTRGLHLDGLADTADGLGSRAPAEQALGIMRRSDIGPFGVLSIVFVVGIDIAALTMFSDQKWHGLAMLVVAATTGRLAVADAAKPGVRAVRPGGFGSLVAGSWKPWPAVLLTLAVLVLGLVLGRACGLEALTVPAIQLGALALTGSFRWHVTRRLGGVTGDVFGALVEICTALTLIALALLLR